MKVACCTHFTKNWSKLADITVLVLEKYCEMHKYVLSVEEVQYEQYTGVDKIMQAVEVLKNNDIVMVMDADAMITNLNIKVESFIKDDFDLYITKDAFGINAGVFIIRHSNWSFNLLRYLFCSVGKDFCEQDALNKYISENGMDKICIVEHPAFNSLLYEYYPETGTLKENQGQWMYGNFILHLPGMEVPKRVSIFNNIKQDIVYE